uniref:Peptidase S74 domain-containing protein n=1 Tax=Ignavibacterium album TaxID=591197 RepID=A0A7V3E8L5_9BACT
MKIRTILLTLILLSAILKAQTGSIRNTLGTGGSFIVKDSANNFLRVEQTTGNVIMLRNLELGGDSISSLTKGVITKGGVPFIHNYISPTAYGVNTFVGYKSGNFTMSGTGIASGDNTAVGAYTLSNISTGSNNSAFGVYALNKNSSGEYNSSFGTGSLSFNTTGSYNSALGYNSLFGNISGSENTALGYKALYYNKSNYNTALGSRSLENNTTGEANTGCGIGVLLNNQTGSYNTAIGNIAGSMIQNGNNNIAIGYNAQVADGSLSNQVRIGNTDISYAGIQVAWSITSDRRWKENIQPTNLGLDFISKLNPVRYNRINDENKKIEYGLIAQELEQVLKEEGVTNSAMLTIDGEGRYELRYNDLFAPMIKAIQELKEENGKLKAKVERLNYIELQLAEMQNLTNELVSQINSLKKSEDNKPFQFTKADE